MNGRLFAYAFALCALLAACGRTPVAVRTVDIPAGRAAAPVEPAGWTDRAAPPQPSPATPAPAPAAMAAVPALPRTLTYCAPGGVPLQMDVVRPAEAGPVPALLYVHGGGWTAGSRAEGPLVDRLAPALVSAGFLVAAIDYRLAPAHPWPAQIDDVRCAIGFLRANASGLGIDPARIGAWGASAGGHLVALAATMGEGPAAVVDLAGPADLGAREWNERMTALIGGTFGAEPRTLEDASPLTHATADDPPMLVVHGDRDDLVPLAQSARLVQRLRAVGAPVRFVPVRGGDHTLSAPRMRPTADALVEAIVRFFGEALAPTRP